MRALYLGYVLDKKRCIENEGTSIAGNKMQMSILNGLKREFHDALDVVTISPILEFPRAKKIFMNYQRDYVSNEIRTTFIPFINIQFVKQITQVINTVIYALYWGLKNRNSGDRIVYCYNYHPNVAIPAIILKSLFKCKIICIFADPVIDFECRTGLFEKLFNAMVRISEITIKKFDGIVAVNKNAIEKYAQGIPYIIVEGGVDQTEQINQKEYKSGIGKQKKVILYSGALYEYNGIKLLIDCMKLLDEKLIALDIYGDGPLKDYVISAAEHDPRIAYKGLVPNEMVMKAQQEADILINPRPISDRINLYTFPSKLLEYMASGTPVITTRLNGITDDYLPHLFIAENDSPECLAATIKYVFSIEPTQLQKIGVEAMRFIIANKNWHLQSKRIHEFSMSITQQ